MRPKTYHFEKLAPTGTLFWEITVEDGITKVRAGATGNKPKYYPDMEHADSRTAFRFTQKQIQKKKKLGYEEVHTQQRNFADHAPPNQKSPSLKRTRPNRGYDAHPHSSGSTWNNTQETGFQGTSDKGHGPTDLRQHLLVKRHKHEQPVRTVPQVHHVNDNDDGDTDSMGVSSDNLDFETDSVASSLSIPGPSPKSGTSPLNRRRLNLRPGESNMDAVAAPPPALLTRVSTTYFLRSQMAVTKLDKNKTVEMTSPVESKGGLHRMETMGKWENWRHDELSEAKGQQPSLSSSHPTKFSTTAKNIQKSDNMYAKLLSSNPKVPEKQPNLKRTSSKTQPSLKKSVSKPSLTRKKSSTTDLRLALNNPILDDTKPKPAGEKEGGLFVALSSPGARGKLKRKATTLLSPISEGPVAAKDTKGLKKGLTKKVMILTPEESVQRRTSPPKRQATLQLDNNEAGTSKCGHKSKKLCVRSPHDGIVGKDGLVYIPDKLDWPVSIPAQVVWYVPITVTKATSCLGQSACLHVDASRCLIAVEDGGVIELDSTVTPVRKYKLPSTVRCLLPDGDFLYAGCQDGGLYDITHTEPRLISHIKGFGQLLSLDVHKGMVAISDQHGNVALVNHSGDILWRHKSKGEFGWMVKMDETGIYHGHSRGLTKYSLNAQVWHIDTVDAVFHGAKTESHMYIAVGHSVMKIDNQSGDLLAKYDEGKSKTTTIHCVEVTDGLVFAGGKDIVCYDEISGDVIYELKHAFKPTCMKYFQGRLLCTGQGSMTAIDLTQNTVTDAMDGQYLEPVEVLITSPSTRQVSPLKRVQSISRSQSDSLGGVLVECIKPEARRGQLLVKAISSVENTDWAIQLPMELQIEGTKYKVEELRPCPAGNFYRVYGDITQVE